MTITLDNLIESSFVISIDKERYDAFVSSLRHTGMSSIPRLIDGFTVNSKPVKGYNLPALNFPILGNSFTHASIVKYGKTFNKDFVCIFEDDAFPCTDISTKLQYYLTDIPDDAEILKLGISVVTHSNNAKLIGNKFIKNIRTWGSHAYIVFKSYYDKYFQLFKNDIICDSSVFNNSDNIYVTKENLFIQRNIIS